MGGNIYTGFDNNPTFDTITATTLVVTTINTTAMDGGLTVTLANGTNENGIIINNNDTDNNKISTIINHPTNSDGKFVQYNYNSAEKFSVDKDGNIATTGALASTGNRVTKGWFTDLEVTNAIVGSITGNAATVSTITGLAPDTATTQATQPNITSLGTLTGLTMGGDIVMAGNSITSTTSLPITTGSGAGHDFTINSTQLIVKGDTGDIGIGNPSPNRSLEISKSSDSAVLEVSSWSTTAGHAPFLILQKSASATINTLSATTAGEQLGIITARGVDTGGNARNAGTIIFEGAAAPNAIAVPGKITFQTSNASGMQTAMTIDDGQLINIPGLTASSDVQTDGSKNLISVSDERLKQDEGLLTGGLNKILQLQPHYYKWKTDIGNKIDALQLGFFAQEVNSIIPEAAPYDTANDAYGFNGRAIIAHLVEAIKELYSMINN